MHFLIAIVLLVSLCWSQFCAPVASAEPRDWFASIVGTVLLVLLCPLLAAAQTYFLRKVDASKRSSFFRSMVWIHSLFWTTASIVIVAWFGWTEFACQVPYATQVPLLDELLIIAPAMMALIASWGTFIFGLPRDAVSKKRSQWSLFAFWIRMQMTFVTAPILIAFLVADCFSLWQGVSLDPFWQTALTIVAGIVFLVATLFYPQLMLLFWPTVRVKDTELELRLQQWPQRCGLRTRKILVWETGNSVVNAAAVGMCPGTEVVLLSDMLLDKFDPDEIDAVTLHELGHIWHRHSIKRAAWILLPLLVLGLDEFCSIGVHQSLLSFGAAMGLGSIAVNLPAILYLIYLLVVIRTVFRKMEFQADRFAIERIAEHSSCPALELALEKMAVIYPKTIDRQSGLHPSIRQRLAHAQRVQAELASDGSQAFSPAISRSKGERFA